MYEARRGEPVWRPAEGHDLAAWSGLEELRESLRLTLVRMKADESDLEDTIQETFLRAASYRRHREVQNLRPWVLRIARNVLADGRRKRARAGVPVAGGEPLEVEACPEGPAARGMRIAGVWYEVESARELVLRGLARLARGDSELLTQHYLAATPRLAGGARRGQSPLKTRLYRARRKLRAVVSREVDLERRLGVAS